MISEWNVMGIGDGDGDDDGDDDEDDILGVLVRCYRRP